MSDGPKLWRSAPGREHEVIDALMEASKRKDGEIAALIDRASAAEAEAELFNGQIDSLEAKINVLESQAEAARSDVAVLLAALDPRSLEIVAKEIDGPGLLATYATSLCNIAAGQRDAISAALRLDRAIDAATKRSAPLVRDAVKLGRDSTPREGWIEGSK